MTDTIPKWQHVTGWVLSGTLALVFLPSAFFKIAQPKGFIEEWSKTYPTGSALPLGRAGMLRHRRRQRRHRARLRPGEG